MYRETTIYYVINSHNRDSNTNTCRHISLLKSTHIESTRWDEFIIIIEVPAWKLGQLKSITTNQESIHFRLQPCKRLLFLSPFQNKGWISFVVSHSDVKAIHHSQMSYSLFLSLRNSRLTIGITDSVTYIFFPFRIKDAKRTFYIQLKKFACLHLPFKKTSKNCFGC